MEKEILYRDGSAGSPAVGKRLLFILFILLLIVSMIEAQEDSEEKFSSVKVTLVEQESLKPVAYCNVMLLQNGKQIQLKSTNKDGEVVFENLGPGLYDIQGIDKMYKESILKNVILDEDDELSVTIKVVALKTEFDDISKQLVFEEASVDSKKKGHAILQITANVLTILCYVLGRR
ncbi:MAG: carboxypeptidase-like regulatory domain-containing protein [Bacteroidia bacterium]